MGGHGVKLQTRREERKRERKRKTNREEEEEQEEEEELPRRKQRKLREMKARKTAKRERTKRQLWSEAWTDTSDERVGWRGRKEGAGHRPPVTASSASSILLRFLRKARPLLA